MFAVHCPTHDARVLIWTSGVERVRNTDAGIEVDWRCTCGQRGTWLTGRKARAAQATPPRVTAGAEYGVMRPLAAAGGLA